MVRYYILISRIIDVRLYVVQFVHICMMMPLDVTRCFMMLYGYFVFGHILYLCLYDGLIKHLPHSCFKMFYAKVSGVNGLFSIID